MKPRIYNRSMELVGILQNATAVGYVRPHNDLFTASFELPYDDPKTALCDTHFIVDVFDGEVSKGKYRILDEPETDITGAGQFLKYSCEHVIAFLLNDVIDGYLEIGGTGVSTRAVIENILSRQTVKRWKLGKCDFNYQFQYSWENTNLLDALYSIPTCFADDYHWTFDTDSYPWTVNLVRQNKDRSCEIRRKRNMQQIKREKDSSALCTRLYCKGSGEGVNQVGIAEVNGGRPYIDADTISLYGVLCSHYIDLQITEPETLLAKGRAVLEEIKHPRYTYKAKAIDLSKITGLDWHSFDEGKYVHLIDEEKGIDLDAMIIEAAKSDVDGDPLDMDITISNKSSDVSSAIEDLSKRAAITAQYSQGATNLYAQQFADNADTNHPASMRVYVPSECKKINKMLLSWRLSAFRAYETGASAGGASVSTTSAGGGSERTSSAGGATTATAEQRVVTTEASTGGTIAGHQGDTSGNTGYARDYNGNSKPETGECAAHSHTMQHHHPGPSHTHTIDAHSHTGGSHSHIFGHYHSAPAHTHTIDGHTHSGPSHTHSGPSHTHSFSGSQSIANGHTHKVTCKASGTTVTSQGVSTNATHTVKISGTTGAAGTGSTGSAGTGQTSSTALTTNSGGGGLTGNAVYASGNAHTSTAESGNVETSSKSLTTNAGGTSDTGYAYYAGAIKNNTGDGGVHTHDMRHVHNFSHSHNVVAVITIPAITLKVPSHTHSVSIPDHSHTVTIQEHTHEIIYGIYEGNTAKSVSINVDGTDIPATDLSADEMDIVKYLSKDSNGKIQRGTWHEIKIIPDGLSRIEANLFVQTFVTSYSGGNY